MFLSPVSPGCVKFGFFPPYVLHGHMTKQSTDDWLRPLISSLQNYEYKQILKAFDLASAFPIYNYLIRVLSLKYNRACRGGLRLKIFYAGLQQPNSKPSGLSV